MMKLGSNSWSYHRTIEEGKLTQKDWIIKCAKELNHDGVELLDAHFPNTEKKYLKKIKKLATDLHLDIYCVSCGSNFGVKDESKLTEQINYVKKWIDIGYFFGAPVVRYFAGSPEIEELKEELWKNMVRATQRCVEYAKIRGIVLALENHNHHGFIQTSEDVLKLSKKFPHWLKMCLDTGNYKDLYKSIEETAHLAALVHAKLYDLDENGVERRLDYNRIFDILKKANFNGYLSIEFEGEENELTAMPRGVAYLRKMINERR